MKIGNFSAGAALLALFACFPASAQTPLMPYQEHEKRIRAAEMVEGLKSDLFGENVSLYTGSTEFSVTDIDVPGNSGLPVQLRRRFAVQSHKEMEPLGGFGSWDIDVPYLYGVFDTNYKWNVSSTTATARCSQAFGPKVTSPFRVHEIWSGNFMHLPGEGDQEILFLESTGNHQLPTDGVSYKWGTRGLHRLSCVPSTSNNYPGEGFVAVDQAGTKYTFDVGIERRAGVIQTGTGYGTSRTKVFLMASRVEDRHGNWIAYNYTAGKLTSITSSDGRAITLTYNGNNIVSASAHGRQWTYSYTAGSGIAFNRLDKLTTVTRPDGSTWKYQYSWEDAGVGGLNPEYIAWDGDPSLCTAPELVPSTFRMTATHPSSAQGVFDFRYKRTTRTGVPSIACVNQNGRYVLAVGRYVDSYGLISKTISGPGIDNQAWTYEYGSAGYSSGVPDSSTVTVVEPDGVRQRYTFGNKVGFNDGRLLKTVVQALDGTILQSKVDTYVSDAEAAAMPFPDSYGSMSGSDDSLTRRVRPVRSTVITQDGVNYSSVVADFDAFARPSSTNHSSTLGYSRSQSMAYHDNLAKWVLGQVKSVIQTSPAPSVLVSQTDYDAADLPWKSHSFGLLQQTLTYHTNGLLATVTDGKGNTTTLSNWKRGVPQSVGYASGNSQSAEVDDNGWIRSITDENTYTTLYDYDAMGRVKLVDYPDGDSVNWESTVSSFAKVDSQEYGIPAGHWKRVVSTGNARKVTYFDALWRPLVEEQYDSADTAGTLSQTVKRYDLGNRLAFQSYPVRGLTNYLAVAQGSRTNYDGLGRTTRVEQDSELGALVLQTEYLTGGQVRIINPRLNATITSYMAYDQPSTDWPVKVVQPEGVHTDIVRDSFGKPLLLRRRNAGSTVMVARQYVYDDHHRLCKTIEPETGATAMAYDAAGNLIWSAAGLTLTDAAACNATEAYSSGRRVGRSYDAMNRLSQLSFPDGNGNQSWEYWPDGLVRRIQTNNGGIQATNDYSYNKRRLLTAEGASQTDSDAWALGYSYDINGNLTHHTYPSGLTIAYAPNALGQPTQAGQYASAVRYHPNGAMAQFTYGNGIAHSLTQNARGLPDRSRDALGSSAVLDDGYDYDANGNVAAITDALPNNRGNRDLGYDGLDRLTTASSPMFGSAIYSYDELDNLRRVKVGARDHSYVYDSTNRLTNVTNTDGGASVIGIGYDAQGNLNNKNGQLYQFDYGNRLREATGKESYRYDGHGRRIQAIHATSGTIRSMYGMDGVLRYQRNQREAKAYDYITLNGSLVAKVSNVIAPATPVLTVPGYSTQSNYTVSWSVVTGASTYELQESAGTAAWQSIYAGAALSTAIAGKPTGNYRYQVRACNGAGCGSWSAIASVSIELAPTQPPTLSVPATGASGSYTVNWTAAAGAASYTLEENSGNGWIAAYTGSAESAVFSAKPAGSYTYRIKACNPVGCSGYSASGTVQVIFPPAAPALSAPSSNYTGSYTVSWTSIVDAVSYQMDENYNGGNWSQVHNTSAISVTLNGRVAGSYGYRVRACNSVGCSANSATGTVLITLPPTGVPSLTAPAATFSSSYDINWTGVAVASSYQLVERLNSGSYTLVYEGAGLSTGRTDRTPGVWDYMARGCNIGGCGPWSVAGSTQVIGAPGAPVLSGATTVGVGAVYSISWTNVANASNYQLEESVNGGPWTFVSDGNTASFTKSAGGSYGYRVRACNPAGCGAYSGAHTVNILQGPPVPTGLRITHSSSMMCRLMWNPSSGATSYQLRDGSGYVHPMGTATSFDWDARCRQPYNVRACNASACSAWSANAN